jgi:hypothetical protein
MGSDLMGRVIDHYGHLPEAEYRVLLQMARVCLDPVEGKPDPGHYYGDRERLADVLRQTKNSTDEGNLRRVDKALRSLAALGAITREHEQPRYGQRQEYRLNGLMRCPPSQGAHPERVPTPEGSPGGHPVGSRRTPWGGEGGHPARGALLQETSKNSNEDTSTTSAEDDDQPQVVGARQSSSSTVDDSWRLS